MHFETMLSVIGDRFAPEPDFFRRQGGVRLCMPDRVGESINRSGGANRHKNKQLSRLFNRDLSYNNSINLQFLYQ